MAIGSTLAVILSACGGNAESLEARDTSTSASVETTDSQDATDDADSTPDTAAAPGDSVAVDETVVFGGYRFTVVEAVLGESLGSPTVSLSIDVENLGPEAGRLDPSVNLLSGGSSLETTGFGISTDIDPGATSNAKYEYQVDAAFTFDGAAVTIGPEGSTQARVPLDGGPVESRDPSETIVDEAGTAEGIELRLDRVRVDWHSLGHHGVPSDAGTAFVHVVVDITLGNQSRTARDTFELMTPDGQTVSPETAPNEVLSPGVPAAGLEVGFIVPDPFAGGYTLRLLNLSRYPDDAMVEIPFSLAPTTN